VRFLMNLFQNLFYIELLLYSAEYKYRYILLHAIKYLLINDFLKLFSAVIDM
jgi:hypothetical protein